MIEIIAEMGINANGDIEIAKKMIDIASAAGCDYVKFQKRTVEVVYTEEELDVPRESPWGTTNRHQKHGLEFNYDDYKAIDRYCTGKIRWFGSPWDALSVGFLHNFKPPFMKIASASLTDHELLRMAVDYGYKLILSTGMSTLAELDAAIKCAGKKNVYCIMHCTSTYPTKTEELNLNCIRTLKHRYPWTKIGFSNHHPGIIYMPVAVALGAEMIEFHQTMDRSMYGSDQSASIETTGVFKVVKDIRNVEIALDDGFKRVYDSEIPIREKLRTCK
jgi:N-acetylneuraminate synthase